MLNKRGYSSGAEFPFHFEDRLDGWAVFDARNDRDHGTGLKQWEAQKLAHELNGSPRAFVDDVDDEPIGDAPPARPARAGAAAASRPRTSSRAPRRRRPRK